MVPGKKQGLWPREQGFRRKGPCSTRWSISGPRLRSSLSTSGLQNVIVIGEEERKVACPGTRRRGCFPFVRSDLFSRCFFVCVFCLFVAERFGRRVWMEFGIAFDFEGVPVNALFETSRLHERRAKQRQAVGAIEVRYRLGTIGSEGPPPNGKNEFSMAAPEARQNTPATAPGHGPTLETHQARKIAGGPGRSLER